MTNSTASTPEIVTAPSRRDRSLEKAEQEAYEERVRSINELIKECPNRAALYRSAEIEKNILESHQRGEPHTLYLVIDDEVNKGMFDILIAGNIVVAEDETLEDALERDQLELDIDTERIAFNRTITYDMYDNPNTLVYRSAPVDRQS